MEIIEQSYYDHDEYGRVKVVDVTNGVVSFEKQNEEKFVSGMKIPGGAKQSAAGFQDDAEPADLNITADSVVFDVLGKNGGN
jgi:hypothetical protein